MDGAPLNWNTVLTVQLYETAVEFQASIRFHEDQLLRLDPSYRTRTLNTYEVRQSQDKYNSPYRTSHARLIGTTNRPFNPPFPKDDANKTKRRKAPKEVGARPCRNCGSGEHWDAECKHHHEGMRTARTRLAETDLSDLQAQDEYDELYYELDSEQDFDSSLQTTDSSCRFVVPDRSNTNDLSALGGVLSNTSNVETDSLPTTTPASVNTLKAKAETACVAYENRPELPPFARKERRRLERLQRRFKRTFHISHHSSAESSGKPSLLELKKCMERPSGCTFLGSKATATYAGVNGENLDILKVIIDSGSDITLISREALQALSSKPKVHVGQKINLVQVTGNSTISGYVNIDLFFETPDGCVKINVDAYVVNGMTTPFILGNDFADQYSISIVRRNGSSYLVFGDTGRELEVESSTAPSIVDLQGRTFQVRVLPEATSRLAKQRKHRWSQKIRRQRKRAINQGEVRARERVVIPPESSTRVPVDASFSLKGNELFIERLIKQDNNQRSFYGSPDSLISKDEAFLHISNFSDSPVVISKGDIVGKAHNPRNWLDRWQDDSSSKLRHAYLIRELAQAQSPKASLMGTSGHMIQSRSDVTSKAQRNASEPDDPASSEPIEGGPKAADLPPEATSSSEILNSLDISPHLTREQKEQLESIILNNALAFGLDGRLGNNDARVEIRLKPDAQPVSLPPFPVSPANREVMDKQMDSWIQLGVIEPSESPWAAPAFIVYRNNKPRMVIDYRKLNSMVIPDEFPLPKQDDIMQALSGSQWLTTLDALSGFTQLIVREDSREKLAFRCHRGLWQFTRMPFGYRNGPSVFQRVMQNILAPFLWIFALVYIDDIVIFSSSFEDHLVHVDKVLKAIKGSGITLSLPKCHFAYQSLLLLGQKVSRLGMSTHREKVEAIMMLETPRNVHELQTFLGMMVYFSAYVPFYAWIAHPLFQLLKKGTPWIWTDLHDEAFNLGKEALSNAPVRGYAKQGLPYRVYTDACDYGLAGILQQVQPIVVRDLKGTRVYDRLKNAFDKGEAIPQLVPCISKECNDVPSPGTWAANFEDTTVHVERVICYWSRVLKSAERNYSPTEREALALKEALIKFQPYIEGEQILAVTDHAALTWSRTFQNINRRLLTWGTIFAAYPNLRIIHRAGRVHSNVDPISRLRRRLPPQDGPLSDVTEPVDLSKSGTNEDPLRNMYEELGSKFEERLLTVGSKFIASESSKQEDFAIQLGDIPLVHGSDIIGSTRISSARSYSLLVGLASEEIEEWRKGYSADPHFAEVLASLQDPKAHLTPQFPQYYYSDEGLLYFEDYNGNNRLCVPQSLQISIMDQIHNSLTESAHGGYHKCYNRLAATHYWPGMSRDLKRWVSTCDICQKTKPRRHGPVGLLQPIPIPTRPFEVVSMDFIPELPNASGYDNILVIVDKLTKYAIFIPCATTITEDATARLFFEHVISKFGIPSQVITDRDSRWRHSFWTETCKLMGMKRALTTAHHPQADGQTEVLNQGLEIALRAYIGPERDDWDQYLNGLALSYNSTPHTSTGYAPAYLLYGFVPTTGSSLLTMPEYIPRSLGDTIAAGRKTDDMHLAYENDKAIDMVEQFEAERTRAKEALKLSQAYQQKHYNQGRLTSEFDEGDWVVLNPHTLELLKDVRGRGKKLLMKYDGPFEIIKKISPVTYQLRLPASYGIHPILNIAHLEKYSQSPPEFGERPTKHLNRADFEQLPEVEVERIVAERMFKTSGKHRRVKKYRVRWAGLPENEDEWKTKEELRNAPQILEAWLRSQAPNMPSAKKITDG